jgi:hypothetical protein
MTVDQRRPEILATALDALDRRRRRRTIRRRARVAGLAALFIAVAAWFLLPMPTPSPSSATVAERLVPEIRELSDDELIELLESAGYRVELIRTSNAVMVRINDGPLLGRPF